MNFLFSPLCPTSLLYVTMYFGVLHKHSADVMRFDIPRGSKLPHLEVAASISLQIQHAFREVLLQLIFLFVNFYSIHYGDTTVQS